MGIPLVQEQRTPGVDRDAELQLEGLPLHRAGREVAVVVESAFANCHNFGVLYKLRENFFIKNFRGIRFLRMYSNCRENTLSFVR